MEERSWYNQKKVVYLQQESRRHGVPPCMNVRRERRTSYYEACLVI